MSNIRSSITKDHENSISHNQSYQHDNASTTSLDSESNLNVESHHPTYSHEVPLELTSVSELAATRQLSKIQSRRSSIVSKVVSNRNNVVDASGEEEEGEEVDNDLEAALTKVQSISKDERFNRFSHRTKVICVIIASMSGFLSPLSSLAFLPAVPEIADRFNTTGEIINVSSAVYCVFMSISPTIFSPCSDIYGRRNTFLVCTFMFIVCTALVAVSQNLAMFFVFRSLTALFGTSFFSIGAHIIGDLYIPVERATYMAWIVSGGQIGTSLGSVGGGIIVTYTSWRVIFWVLCGIGAGMFLLAFFYLPETCYETKHSVILKEIQKDDPKRKFVFIPFNPLKIIAVLKYPNLSIDGFITIALVFNMYNLLTPIRYVVDPRFGLTKPIFSGLFYLAPGLGYLLGSFFGGRWADYVVRQYIKKRGRRVPEDRLRQTLIPLGIIYPTSILIYGWSIEKEKGGMAVPIIFMFFSGIAQTCVFPASNTYCVDSMPELGGDAIGSSYFTRYIAAAVSSATCLRSIQSIGVGWTCTIGAFVLWLGLLCALVLIYFGERMRIKALIRYGKRSPEDYPPPKS
ncbi:A Q resistance [Scheffersomyces coipomensis]|uniref:A Q resistance n=1 Tax=Scheffersomyces coipomensis TaxID=1788519 RepID=UPI00315CB423